LLAYLFFIIGLNLSGLFEFGGEFTNIGGKLTQGNDLGNSFFTGVLATLVATPRHLSWALLSASR
jgi:thiol:disulfide interchange protein